MSGGYCAYCCAQTAWDRDPQSAALYCIRCNMQPQTQAHTPKCQNCGSRAGFYEDNQRGARYCRYCRQMMTQTPTTPVDPRYAPDPLQGLRCPYCARGDEIYNTTEGGGFQKTMCRRCRRPVPTTRPQQQQDIRTHVNPDLFRVYDEFDPVSMRKRFENVQPSTGPQPGQIPQMQAPPAPPITPVCSNCHTTAYLVPNPSTGFLQCKRCGQWVGKPQPPAGQWVGKPQPPASPRPVGQPPAGPRPAWPVATPAANQPQMRDGGAPRPDTFGVGQPSRAPSRHGFAPILQNQHCQDCGVRGVVMGGLGELVCPQCQRQIQPPSLTPNAKEKTLSNIQALFEPGSPERVPQPNRIGQRDDDLFGF